MTKPCATECNHLMTDVYGICRIIVFCMVMLRDEVKYILLGIYITDMS